jgi:AcrR family transcriptional regulator
MIGVPLGTVTPPVLPSSSDRALAPRERLLAAAVDYAAEHGISDVSLRTLATGLGTSHRMLIHHFGSKEGLLAAVVTEVERRQREALADLDRDLEAGASRAETARAWWQRFADPALWPYERLFFELYAQALQGRTHALALTEDLLEPWIGPVAELYERRGVAPRRARAAARLGVAVTRGLLLDLLASGERAGVDDAMELFIELSGPLLSD